MLKLLALAVACLVSHNAAAEWVKVGGNERLTFYVDPSTIRKAGNMVKMWSLSDYITANVTAFGKPHLSEMLQLEYDCKEEQSRVLALTFHSENMAKGEITYKESSPRTWEPVPPGSGVATMWKIACAK